MALPFILAGPIVRRVEPRLAAIWLATSQSCDITVTIWPGPQVAGTEPGSIEGPTNPWASSAPTPTRPVGGKLHIALVVVEVAESAASMLPGTVYSYNAKFEAPPLTVTDLRRENLLVDEDTLDPNVNGGRIEGVDASAPFNLALGYQSGRLPSFVTCPTTLDELFLIQSGCRNTNSDAHDTTAWIDDVIRDGIDDPLGPDEPLAPRRPHQLFLTGDQVYIDDVNLTMLPLINRLGLEVFDSLEKIPLETGLHEVTLANFPVMRRAGPCKKLGHFSAGSTSHLISFAEVCAMYLHAWSPAVWRDFGKPEDDVFVDNDAALDPELQNILSPYKTRPGEKVDPAKRITDAKSWSDVKFDDYTARLARAVSYRATVPRVRRALANCATYMIFDDHEVTDDWNISKERADRTATSPFGRSVLRNALSAYTLFQGWGNDPKKFAEPEVPPVDDDSKVGNKDLLDKVVELQSVDGIVQSAADAVEAHLGLSGSPPDVDWHYTIDGTLHRALVIETRTRRSYASLNSPAKLLGSSLKAMVPDGPLTDGREVLILVAPQPPLMPALFDQIAQPLGGKFVNAYYETKVLFGSHERPIHQIEAGTETLENESWGLEENGLEELLAQLAPYRKVVILSGDVHFSAGLTLDYWRKGQPSADRIVQFILSPSKNEWTDIVVNFVRGTTFSQRFAEIGMPAERLAWKKPEDVLVPPALDDVPPGTLARMRATPALLPAKGWPPGTDFKQVDNADVLPDWRWRMGILLDERPDADRPDAVRLGPPGPDIAPTDPMNGYFAAAQRHQNKASNHFDHVRRLVFPAGIGLVTFPEINGVRHARHTILTRTPGNPDEFVPNTVHQVSLDPTTDQQPEIVTTADGAIA